MFGLATRRALFAAACALLATDPAIAEDQLSETGQDGKTAARMNPVTVTATRNPIAAFDYPGMVTVIGRDEIETRQASSPDDILRFVPNVEFTGGPRRNGEVPSIRGFSGADVVILMDGARQNWGAAHDGRFYVEPSLLRQVEVLRGPASSLYGSGGTGGVIEFTTLRADDILAPGEDYATRFSAGHQTVNHEYSATTQGFARPIEGLDIVTSMTRRFSGSIELGDGTKLDRSDDDIIGALAKINYDIDPVNNIEFSANIFRNDAEEPNNGQGAGGLDVVDKDISNDNYRLAYGYHDPTDRVLDLDASIYRTTFGADELRLDNNGTGPQGQVLRRDVETIGTRVDNRSRLNLLDDSDTRLTYGMEAYQDYQEGSTDNTTRDGVPDAKSRFGGVFGQGELNIAEPIGLLPGEVNLITGLRFDAYESNSSVADRYEETALSPRIGASYFPLEWLMVFGNYAEAFRAPTFDEAYLEGTHFTIPVGAGVTNRFVANPNLKPQRTKTVEVGGGVDFSDILEENDQFQFKASRFWIKGKDFIDFEVIQPTVFVDCNPFIPGACDGTAESVNVPSAKLFGSEIEASYENKRLRFAFGYSTVDGKNADTGTRLGVLTPDEYTLDSALKLPEIFATIGWRVLRANRFDKVNDPDDIRDAYTVHDFYVTVQPEEYVPGLRLDFGVDNAFDRAYSRVNTGVYEAGRNFKGTVSYIHVF